MPSQLLEEGTNRRAVLAELAGVVVGRSAGLWPVNALAAGTRRFVQESDNNRMIAELAAQLLDIRKD